MQLKHVALAFAPLVLASIACSSIDGTGFGEVPSASGGPVPTSTIDGVAGPCPTDPYTSNATCMAPLRCEYGKSSSLACNVVADCTDLNVFDITPPSETQCDPRCPTFDAPGALSTAQGMPCMHGSLGPLVCGSPYDRSTCGCVDPSTVDGGVVDAGGGSSGDATTTGSDGGNGDGGDDGGDGSTLPPDVPGVWVCVTAAVGCPATRPTIGSSCVNLITCDYGACAFPGGMKLVCTQHEHAGDATWVDQTPIKCGGKT